MKYLLWTSAALLLAISQPPPAQAQSAREMVNQAIAAQGGADALRALHEIARQEEHGNPEILRLRLAQPASEPLR